MEKLVYTIKEAAQAIGLSRTTIYKLTREEKGFPSLKCGNKTLIPRRELEEWFSGKVGKSVLPDGVNGKRGA